MIKFNDSFVCVKNFKYFVSKAFLLRLLLLLHSKDNKDNQNFKNIPFNADLLCPSRQGKEVAQHSRRK